MIDGRVAAKIADVTSSLYRKAVGQLGVTDYVFMNNQTGGTPATPTAGGVLYVEAGALKFKGSGGTITTIGPA